MQLQARFGFSAEQVADGGYGGPFWLELEIDIC
jgi:hypothetical protein